MRSTTFLVLAIVLTGGCSGSRSRASSGKIVFPSRCEIYIMNGDGSGRKKLTSKASMACDDCPSLSPDGTKIAFLSNREGERHNTYKVYVMNADGTQPTQITKRGGIESTLSWSPDASRIVLMGFGAGYARKLYAVALDETGSIVPLTAGSSWEVEPSWSPDGTKIAFSSNRDAGWGIYVMDVDGGNAARVTPEGGGDPAWSPDGTKIAFGRDQDIYVMGADGSSPTRLTTSSGRDEFPTWSPDGTQIAFASQREGTSEIYVMSADGSGQKKLAGGAGGTRPHWR